MKIKIFFIFVLSLFVLSGCSSESIVEFNVLNVKDSEIIVTFDKNSINESAKSKLADDYNLITNDKLFKLIIPIENTKVKDSVEMEYQKILSILKNTDNQAYLKIKDMNFDIDSTIGGFPFSSINSILLNMDIEEEFDIILNPQGSASINNGEYLKQISIKSL